MNLPTVNLKETGFKIRTLMDKNDLKVRDIQNALGFSTPQAVYKWLHGKNLPTVDNLVILSSVLGTTIDEIIVID